MTDEDVNAVARETSQPPEYEKHVCAECGKTDGIIQHTDIAWPGSKPFYLYLHVEGDDGFMANPRRIAGRMFSIDEGLHLELWLHRQCVADCLERLERERKSQ